MRLFQLLAPALLCAPTLLAQRLAEVESNDTVALAQLIPQGWQVDANFVTAEFDWYVFTTLGGRVRITTSGAIDPKVSLWNAAGTIALGINDDSRGLLSDISLNLTAGTYTIRVEGSSLTSAGGPYSLDVAVSAPPKGYTSVEIEPNENVAQAQLVAAGAQINGSLAAPVTVLSDLVPAPTIVLSDVVVASTTTVITATAVLVASAYALGYSVQMTSGPNIGLIRQITANTATTITTAAWPVVNTVGNTYDVITLATSTVIRATSALTPSAYVGGAYFVRFTSGLNIGLDRQISSNTASTLSCLAFPTAAATGDTFDIVLGDIDVYRMVLTAPRTGVWFQVTEGDAPWLSASRWEIWDAAGALLIPTATLGLNAGSSSIFNPRQSQIRCWPAGTYHFVVRRQPSNPTNNNLVPFGNYRFEYFAMPMNTGAVVPEVGTNDTFATATPITFGQQGTGNITIVGGLDPSDWWGPITLSNPSVIMFQTGQGAATAIQDTTVNLRAYDPITNTVGPATAVVSGNILDPTSHARGTFIFSLTPNSYYLEVISPGTLATQAGNYVLEIGAVLSAPYCPASYAIAAVNAACGIAPFPTIGAQFTNESPTLGQSFVRTLSNAPAGAAVFLLQGFNITLANGGTTPLPYVLGPMAVGCTVNVDPLMITLHMASGTGTVELIQNTPTNVGLRGLAIYEQALVVNPAANVLGLQLSNYGRQIIGDRSF